MKPIIGQEAICPDGLGRVSAFGMCVTGLRIGWIQVETYFHNRGCQWDSANVELLDPTSHNLRTPRRAPLHDC